MTWQPKIETARLLTLKSATLQDEGRPFITEASMAKMYCSRVAVECADKAVQMHGGAGYFAPTNVERYYRDAKVTEIYEGDHRSPAPHHRPQPAARLRPI